MSKDRHILIKKYDGTIILARCKHCSHIVREIRGERVSYLGMCDAKITPGQYMDVYTSVGVNNFACCSFDPQCSFTVVEDCVQTSLFN